MSLPSPKAPAIREIPGFYYDEEIKKYFRITKDHPGLRKNTKAKEDIKKLKDDELKVSCKPIFQTLQNREIHGLCTEKVRRSIKRTKISNFKLWNETDLRLHLEDTNLTNSVSIRNIVPNARQDILAIESKIKGSCKSILQIYDIQFTKDKDFELVAAYDILIGQISDVIFSPFENRTANKLVISSINERLNISQAALFHVDSFLITDRVIKVKKNQSIWSSCFMQNSSVDFKVALGLSSGILMVGPENRGEKHPFVKTSGSDVLALNWSKMAHSLYSGSRDGYIRCCDYRCMSIVAAAKAKKSIDCLKILKNEFHLLVSTMAGHLELWDIRAWKPVLSYSGHKNTHSLLSFRTDENEDFIAAVGEDCIARIWDLKTADCLRDFPSFRFDRAGEPLRPSIVFIDQFSHSNISSGLLYGIGEELHYYRLL